MFFPCIFSFFFFFPLCTFSFFLSLSIPLTAFSFQIINKKKIILCCIFLFLRLMPTIFHFHSSHSLPFNYGRELHSSQRTRELSSDTDCLRTSNNQIGSKENDPSPTRNKCGRLKQGCEPPAVTPDCAGPFADSLDILCCKKKKKEWNTIKRKYFTCISLIFSICATSLTPLTHQANFLGIQLDWARTDNQTKKPTHSWTHVHWKC